MALNPLSPIMSLFGGSRNSAPQNTQPPGQQGNPQLQQPLSAQQQLQQSQQPAGAAANPTNPGNTNAITNQTLPGNPAAIPPPAQGDKSPLANFADLWKTPDNAGQGSQPTLVPQFNLDPKGLSDAAAKVNFTVGMDQALVVKALGGDAEAFNTVLNEAVRRGFISAVTASGELVKNSFGSAEGILRKDVLPTALRQHNISQAVDAKNPIFSDPTVSPMLDLLKTQLMTKYTTASAEEIATTAESYLAQMSSKIVSASGATVVPKGQGQNGNRSGFPQQQDQDWETFFAMPNQ